MTQPAAPPDQIQQQQRQTQALASVLAAGVTAGSVAALVSLTGVSTPVAAAVLALSGVGLPVTAAVAGPASRLTAAAEPSYRAAYLLAAARRVQALIDAGMSRQDAVAAERRFAVAHRSAQANRRRAAVAVDQQAARHGVVLGWYARMDARTSAECAAANGKNFTATRPPLIGYPGAVHPHCRCRPGVAHTGAGWVDNVTTAAQQPQQRRTAVA